MLPWLLSFVILCSILRLSSCVTVNISVILPMDPSFDYSLQKIIPAVTLAVENIAEKGLLPDVNFSIRTADSECSPAVGPLAAFDFYVARLVNVFLGPVCEYAIAAVARYSPFWDIPVLSAGAMNGAFDNKTEYRLLTRVHAAFSDISELMINLALTFEWSVFEFIFPEKGTIDKKNCAFQLYPLYEQLKKTFSIKPWLNTISDKTDFQEILQLAATRSRIVVLCASAESVRNIMIKAHELSFDNGEYVFFNIDLFSSKNESAKPWYNETDTPERNDKARKAYEALMTVTLRKPISPEYKNFSREVKRRAKLNNENFTYGEEEVNSFVGAFHDAVLLYAIALNETLEMKGNITNGTEITRRMWNRTFKGITGNVSIDANGDRNADYSLLDMDPETGEFLVVANYFGNTKQYEPVPGRSIRWAGGYESAPPDTPKCGFDRSKCPPDEPFSVLVIVSIVVPVVLLLAFLIVFIIGYRCM